MIRTFLLLGLALLAGSVGAQNTTAAPTNATGSVARRCPPAGWDTVSNLDLRAWSAAPWYIQANVVPDGATPTACNREYFSPIWSGNGTDRRLTGFSIDGSANMGNISGPLVGVGAYGTLDMVMVPRVVGDTSPTAASKVLRGPYASLLEFGINSPDLDPYNIIAVGPSTNPTEGYAWAIMIYGRPRTWTGQGCRSGGPVAVGNTTVDDAGDLVLMTRKDLDADSLKAMLVWLAKNGYDYSMLTRVEQGGCRYPVDPETFWKLATNPSAVVSTAQPVPVVGRTSNTNLNMESGAVGPASDGATILAASGRAAPPKSPATSASPSPKPAVAATPSPAPAVAKSPSPTPAKASSPSPKPTKVASPSPMPVKVASPSPKPVKVASPSPKPVKVASPSPKPVRVSSPSPKPAGVASASPKPPAARSPSPKPAPPKSPSPKPSPARSPSTNTAPKASPAPSKTGAVPLPVRNSSPVPPKQPTA